MEKKKRIVTRLGDIFCVEIDNQYKAYFQYIAKDWEMLNSTVIRSFKSRYPIDYNPTMDEIVNDEVYFYAHTILRAGFLYDAWHKVGTSKNLGNTENIKFRVYNDFQGPGQTKSYKWYVWTINQPWQFVGEMTDEYREYDWGPVLSYENIVSKIKTGKFKCRVPD